MVSEYHTKLTMHEVTMNQPDNSRPDSGKGHPAVKLNEQATCK